MWTLLEAVSCLARRKRLSLAILTARAAVRKPLCVCRTTPPTARPTNASVASNGRRRLPTTDRTGTDQRPRRHSLAHCRLIHSRHTAGQSAALSHLGCRTLVAYTDSAARGLLMASGLCALHSTNLLHSPGNRLAKLLKASTFAAPTPNSAGELAQ